MRTLKKISLFLLILFIPLFLQAEVLVKTIKSAEDLPEAFCTNWKIGDFLISDRKYFILIGGIPRPQKTLTNYPAPHAANAMGSILSFVPAGKNAQSNLNIGSPVMRIANKSDYITYSSVRPLQAKSGANTLSFECLGYFRGKDKSKAEIRTTYEFLLDEGKILIDSTLTNTGAVEFKELSYSIYFSANHSYYFSPYHRKIFPKLNFRIYQKKEHYLAWLNPNPVEEEGKRQPGKLAPGEAFKATYTLFVNPGSKPLLRQIYQILEIRPVPVTLDFKNFNGKLMEVIVREAKASTVFFRSFLKEPSSLKILLLEGSYSVRANFFPAVNEKFLTVKPEAENFCILENPSHGAVKIKIQNGQGEFVPGKVSFIGLAPTKTPYFVPENPVETGKSWEDFKNSCFPQEEGLEIGLPCGTYLTFGSRGPEYTMDKKVIEVLKDETQQITFTIDKVIERTNLISLDLHLHTQNSDGSVLIPERLKSIVAEGVEVAIATDHNYITDYRPALQKLGLNKYLTVLEGSETNRPGLIHYNTYPQTYRPDEENNGAILPLTDDVSFLFKLSREKDPGAILQVNHPRLGNLGYFNNCGLDPESAAFALKNIATSFDVLEVMNGANFFWDNNQAVEDWFHLLNRGYYFPITGSSDSHDIDTQEPGYSRTYILYQEGKGDALDSAALVEAIRKGKAFVSNGPILEFRVNNRYTFGDSFTAKDGKVTIDLEVSSSPWVYVDEVKIIVNGERKIVFPVNAQENNIHKYKGQINLTFDRDSWIVVEVLGKKTLYPVVQQRSSEGFLREAALPYALGNPVFVDVDGNGQFDPLWPEKIRVK